MLEGHRSCARADSYWGLDFVDGVRPSRIVGLYRVPCQNRQSDTGVPAAVTSGRIATWLDCTQCAVQPFPAMIPFSEVAPDLIAVPAQGRSREHQAADSHWRRNPVAVNGRRSQLSFVQSPAEDIRPHRREPIPQKRWRQPADQSAPADNCCTCNQSARSLSSIGKLPRLIA